MEFCINDQNYARHINPLVGDERKAHGLIPRDFATHGVGYLGEIAKPFDIQLIPESEWQSRLDAQIAAKAQLSNIRNTGGPNGGPIPSRDQDSKGYCWAHSSVSAALVCRAMMNEPYADLSAFAVACIIKGYRDEGGWGAESLEWIAASGVPTSEFWPQQSMSRANDNPNMRANAKLHRYTDWRDFDPKQMKAQLVTWLLLGLGPVVTDFNWWSHSVCTIDLVSINPFKTRIWNSWGDSWSENGTGILEGSKAIPDAALGAIAQTPSMRSLPLYEAVSDIALPIDVASTRAAQANSFDRILGLPRIMVGPNSRKLVYANQAYWQQAADKEAATLLSLVPKGDV